MYKEDIEVHDFATFNFILKELLDQGYNLYKVKTYPSYSFYFFEKDHIFQTVIFDYYE